MGFFKKTLATTMGVGGAKVDTVLKNSTVVPGGVVEGVFKIKGGKVEQKINGIIIDLSVNYTSSSGDSKARLTHTLPSIKFPLKHVVKPGSYQEAAFSFRLDHNFPISIKKHKTKLKTRLDIEGAVDDTDGDELNVEANIYMQNVLDAFKNLGFKLNEIENERKSIKERLPILQEFEFIPVSGKFKKKLDEVELIFTGDSTGIKLFIEVDRKVKNPTFLCELFELDEKHVNLYFSYSELQNKKYIEECIYNLIKKYAK